MQQDTDKDGTDDSCDGFINQSPLIVEPEPDPGTTTHDVPENPQSQPQTPDEETINELLSSPKPPENNPETAAGNEQLAVTSLQTSTIINQTVTTERSNETNVPTNTLHSTPQVAGLNTQSAPISPLPQTQSSAKSSTIKETTNPFPFIVISIFLILLVARYGYERKT